jgi:hypothetical protein
MNKGQMVELLARKGVINAYTILVRKLEGKTSFQRPGIDGRNFS